MKSLPILKRLHNFTLDEHKRKLGALNKKLDRAETELREMLESHKHQQHVKREYALHAPQLDGHIYGNYVKAIEQRRKEILKEISEINRDIFLEVEELQKVFREGKKLDLIEDEMKEKIKSEDRRKENNVLDELGQRLKWGIKR